MPTLAAPVEIEADENFTPEYLAWFKEQVAQLVTEDDTPVDNPFSEKQQRLLVETLYTGWTPPPNAAHPAGERVFWSAANVALFLGFRQPPVVPDVFLSLDVAAPGDQHEIKSYFYWEFGKAPEVAVEIVSNTKGGELSNKLLDYERLGVRYYIVYDPDHHLSDEALQVFTLHGASYQRLAQPWLPEVGLGVTLWRGVYENVGDTYLRWVDQAGNLLPTGNERAAREAERAAREAERAAREAERAERLAAKLRELGLNPEQL